MNNTKRKFIFSLFFFIFLIVLFKVIVNGETVDIHNTEIKLKEPFTNEKNNVDFQTKILFIGSSYFNYNNLPALFEEFTIDTQKPAYIDSRCINGWYLETHANSPETDAKINEMQWDYVILQGCGINMAYPEYDFAPAAYPALEVLCDKIYDNCASTIIIFNMPWAFEDGMIWYQDWTDTFEDMQLLIYNNTVIYSNSLYFQIAPVGWTWYEVLEEKGYPLHYLHLSDWNHPSLNGTYLMACVLFSTVFLESSIGIQYTAGLPEDEVTYFQTIASETVLNDLLLWNIKNVEILWNRTYGGLNLDWGWSVQSTNDNGYIIGGETVSYGEGNYDAYLIKTNNIGMEEWNNTFGGSAKDGCRAVQQTQDGGYILTGYTDSYGNQGHDYWIIKTDEFGQEIWSKVYGGVESDASYEIIETSTGDFVCTGYSYSNSNGNKDAWVIKTNSQGEMIWENNFGGYGVEYGMSIIEASDGNYIIVGSTTSYGSGGTDIYLLKIGIGGELIWEKTYGGSNEDWAGSIDNTVDGGFIIVGDTASFGAGGFDVFLLKVDNLGNEIWSTCFGDSDSYETGYSVRATLDGGFIVSGAKSITTQFGDNQDALIIKTNNNGMKEWEYLYGGSDDEIGYSVCQQNNDEYVITGYTESFGNGSKDIFLLKIIDADNQAPVADFMYSPKNPKTNEQITFTDKSYVSDGYIVNWTWDFGDGVIKYTQNINHYYSDDGSYNVILEVRDNNDRTNQITKIIPVSNRKPYVDFTHYPENPIINESIQFTDNSSDSDGIICNWTWQFGDQISYYQHPTYQFNNTGGHIVCLSIIDDDNASNTTCKTILIVNPDEIIDINQDVIGRGFPIRHTWDGDWGAAQNFTATLNTLTKCEIYLRKFGTPEFNLTVELRTDHPEGTLLDSLSFTVEEIASSWQWLELDFSDITVEPDTNLFIVLPPAPSTVTTSFGYEWGYAFDDQYWPGSFWFTRDGGGLWSDLPTRYEFVFKTYGYS